MICLGLGLFGLSPRENLSETTLFVHVCSLYFCGNLHGPFQVQIEDCFPFPKVGCVFSLEGRRIVPLATTTTTTTAKTTAATATTRK